jgi:hypothetical protein
LDLSLDGLKLAHVPIIYQLFKEDIYSKVLTRPLSQQSRNMRKLSHYTVVTPEVYAHSSTLFLQCFKVVKPYNQVLKTVDHSLYTAEVHGASPSIEWIGSPFGSLVYHAVKIGKTIYMVSISFSFFFVLYLINLLSQEKLLLCFLEKILIKQGKEMPKL